MKVICNGLELADALGKVIKAIPVKKGIPILEGVKITAEGNELTLSATDTNFAIIKTIKADVMIEGGTVVPGKFFAEFIRKLSNEEQIELTLIDELLKIKYMDSETKMQCLSIEEFPPINAIEHEITISFEKKDFKELVNRIIFSASTDEVRPILKGVLFKIEQDTITGVALDGFRLAIAKKKLNSSYESRNIIIPAKALFEISKLIEDDENVVNMLIGDKKLMVDMDHTKIITTLLEGEFIQYEKIIPARYETHVVINKEQFENGLDRAAIISRQSKNNLIKLDVKEKLLTISAYSAMGDVKEKVVISLEGKDITIGFNDKYISDCLKVIDDEFIKMEMNDSLTPCVIVPTEGEDYFYLILPIRIVA